MLMSRRLFKMNDTVAGETPASRATSRFVTRCARATPPVPPRLAAPFYYIDLLTSSGARRAGLAASEDDRPALALRLGGGVRDAVHLEALPVEQGDQCAGGAKLDVGRERDPHGRAGRQLAAQELSALQPIGERPAGQVYLEGRGVEQRHELAPRRR